MTKTSKINTELVDLIQLVSEQSVIQEFGQSAASVSKDQVVTWAKFILTDDRPNANKERIPSEEFDNIINTGFFKPIKMAVGEIKDGHEDAEPIGVITHLTKDGNKIVALAALWETERTEDVLMIKDRINSGKPVNVSWEVYYGDRRESNGITDLLDTILRAVTIVGMPAYAGRTPVLAVAAKKWSTAYIQELPDSHFLYIDSSGERMFPFRDSSGKIDTKRFPEILEEITSSSLPENLKKGFRHQIKKLNSAIASDTNLQELLETFDIGMEDLTLDTKELETKVAELEGNLSQANDSLSQKDSELDALRAELQAAKDSLQAVSEELTSLREFKSQADALAEKEVKMSAIKEKFTASGLERPDTYFAENAEKLLSLDEAGLDFMLQEMVAFASSNSNQSSASSNRQQIPNFNGETGEKRDLAKELREYFDKKK